MPTSSPKRVPTKKVAATQKSPLRGTVNILTPQELHQSMQSFGKALADDPEAATSFLQDAGILTPTGKLTKAYRG